MKTWMLCIVALASVPGGTLLAQNLTGTWQGTLKPNPTTDLRIVFKISTSDKDALKGVMYSIDQKTPAIPLGAVTVQGSSVKLTIPAIGGSYEGKLGSDGNSVDGNWSQGGPNPLPLRLVRATDATAWTIPDAPPPPKKMKADADPSFEVATIKPSDPNAPGQFLTVQGDRMVTRNTSLSFLITFAYNLHAKQISGGPAWLDSEKYDINAKPDVEGQPSVDQLKTMTRKLLADRLKLTFHKEKKELSVYAITVGKTGSRLTKSEGDPNGLPGLGFRGLGKLIVRNATIADFAGLMQNSVLDRPVLDQTGLAGRFDFTLDWTPEPSQFGGRGGQAPQPGADDPAALPDLFTAIVAQLGLRLESAKAPVDVLVVDHIEKPSDN
jgi:uncharacterized protein (TIGR03435 family)